MSKSEIGLIGLGTMGAMLSLNIADNGFAISVFNRTTSRTKEFFDEAGELSEKITPCDTLEDLVASISEPRAIILMVPAGAPVDEQIAARGTSWPLGKLTRQLFNFAMAGARHEVAADTYNGLKSKAVTAMSLDPYTADSPLSAAISQRDSEVMEMVRNALHNRDVLLAYQPIVQCADTNRVAFYEGLIRVLDETGRVIPARDFINTIEVREEGRLIDCLAVELGLESLFLEPRLRLSINMSPRSIGHPKWETALERGLLRDPTIGERLIIEITESSALLMPDVVADFMVRMQKRGVSFALDDFGAGYTAFRHFRDLYFDIVKIDTSFARNVHLDSDNQVLMQALVSIAQQFDMFTVAEGVERPEEVEYLAKIGIDCLQGYLFGVPTPSKPWDTHSQDSSRLHFG
ncbi:putative signaling protein [Nymphon striatum]|nr:putative signaling protein [Nymphon striatum]